MAERPAAQDRHAVLVVYEDYARDSRVRRHARSLAGAGWAVHVLGLGGAPAAEAARRDGVGFTAVEERKYRGRSRLRYAAVYARFALRVAVALVRRTARRPGTLVIVNGPPDPLVFAALPTRLRGARIMLDVHDMTSELFAAKFGAGTAGAAGGGAGRLLRLVRLAETLSYRVTDGLLTVHPGYRDGIAARAHRPVIDVLNSPDDPAWIAMGDARTDDGATGVPGSPLVLGHHGTIVHRFGIDLAVRAVAILREQGRDVRLRILGDGDFAPDVLALIAELGLGDRIRFERRVFQPHEVPAFLDGVHAGVAPYRMSSFLDEAVPVKVLEYLTLGLPVIGTPTAALSRVIPAAVMRSVPEGTDEALAAAIVELADPAARRRMRDAARPVARAIAWPAQEARLLDWLESRVGAGGKPR